MDNWKSATFHSGPFVGRTREINGLINTYQTVQRGQTRIVILKGVVGIGKSRLATEFLKKAQLLGAHILQARPFEVYACPPYQPIIDALSSYYPQTPNSSEIIAEQLYDSVAQAVQQLAEQRPVVLFIDNLTLADTATLDMLYAIGQRWLANNAPVLLLLSFREEALVTRPALAEWFTRIEQDLRASSVTLSHLKVEHVTQFIRQLINKSADASDVSLETIGRWLSAETHGLPLYMVEVLDTLLDHNILSISTQADGKWGIDLAASALSASKVQSVLQPNMRSVIRARLTLLSAHASTLLAAAAVLARPFSFEQVRLIADLEDHDGCAALDEILARHLLEEVGDGYFFTHDIIREIAYTEIPEAQQRSLHQSTLQVLEGEWSHDPSHAAELAYHAEAAGLWEQAFHRYVAAADYALQQRAVKNAIDLYEAAGKQFLTTRSLHDTLTAIPASALQHHHLQLGRAYESIGKKEQAHSVYSNMVLQARRAGLVEYVYVGLNHLARLIKDYKVDFAEAQELRRQMLQLINDVEEDGDIAVRAETEMHIAQLSFYRFDIISVLTYAKRALQLARKGGLQEIAARSLYELSLATLLQGDWEAVISYAREARDLYQVLQNPLMEAQCLNQVAKAHISTGQLQEGLAAAREAYKIDLEVGDPSMIVYSTYHLVTALLETGAYAEALTLAQQTMTTARTCSNSVMLALALTTLGRVYRALLDIPSAYRAHNEAQTCYRDLPQEPLMEQIDADLCVDCALAGNWQEAYTYAMQGFNHHNDHAYAYQTLTRWYEIAALLQAGDLQRATQDVQSFEARTHNNPRYRIPYLRALAKLDFHHQHIEQALEHLQEAMVLAQQIGLPGELCSLEIERAELFARQGDQLEASRSRAHAVEIAHTLVESITDERTRNRFLENVRVQQIVS